MRRALAISALFVPFVMAAMAACVGDDASSPSGSDSGAGGDTGGPPPPPPPGNPPPPSPTDGGGDAAPANPCNPTDPWTFVGPVVELNQGTSGASDIDARLSPDQLTIFWITNRTASNGQIWTGTRSSTSAQFGSLAQVPIPYSGNPSGPSPGPFPDALYFAISSFVGEAVYSIEYSTKSGATWSTPTTVANASAGPQMVVSNPYLPPDALTLLFQGPGSFDASAITTIYEVDRPTTMDDFGVKKELAEIASPYSQVAPVLSKDKLAIYFGTNRTRAPMGETNGFDVWVATRAKTTDPFGAPVPAQGGGINSATATLTTPSWISDDQCTMYLSSNRFAGGNTNPKVFKATRPPPP